RLAELLPRLDAFPRLRARALSDLGVIGHATGDRARAVACLEAALAADASYVPALENLADVVAAVGDHLQAVGLRLDTVRHEPEDALLWAALGVAAASAGLWPVACDAAQRARSLDPEHDGLAALDAVVAAGPQPDAAGLALPGKLLVAVDHFFPSSGGSERLAEDAGIALRDLGWQVEIVTRALPDRVSGGHRGMAVHEVDPDRGEAELAAVVARVRPDAILAFAAPLTWPISGPLNLPHPRPQVVVVPCVNGDGDASLRADRAVLRRYAAQLAGAGAVGHSSLRGFDAALCRELGLPPAYVPNAVVVAEPDPDVLTGAGLAPDEPILLVVGNNWPEKDHVGLLAHVAACEDDLPIVMVGNPSPYHPDIAARIAEAAARDPRVRRFGGGTREEVAGLMRAAKALLLPSRVEATPLVILEAMSHGLPWIATPGCGAVHEHAGGLIVPLDEFLPTARTLLADERARRVLGAAGREHWAACYTWEAIAPRYDALLRGARELPPLAAPTGGIAIAA
ncbi:MAG TPA: glycosyltransferase family 4 protein, partial [Baekduia sp.]|nr:glycosyltransferase family 4 protein [Baekduia sp.]